MAVGPGQRRACFQAVGRRRSGARVGATVPCHCARVRLDLAGPLFGVGSDRKPGPSGVVSLDGHTCRGPNGNYAAPGHIRYGSGWERLAPSSAAPIGAGGFAGPGSQSLGREMRSEADQLSRLDRSSVTMPPTQRPDGREVRELIRPNAMPCQTTAAIPDRAASPWRSRSCNPRCGPPAAANSGCAGRLQRLGWVKARAGS